MLTHDGHTFGWAWMHMDMETRPHRSTPAFTNASTHTQEKRKAHALGTLYSCFSIIHNSCCESQLTGASVGSCTQYGLPCKMLISLFVQGYAERKGCGSFCFMFCLHTAFSFMVDFYKIPTTDKRICSSHVNKPSVADFSYAAMQFLKGG